MTSALPFKIMKNTENSIFISWEGGEGLSLLDFCVKHLQMLKSQFSFGVRDGKVAPGFLKKSGTVELV